MDNNIHVQEISHKIIQLSKNISRITLDYGLHPNTGVSAGPDGVLLIDTGHKQTAENLKNAVKESWKGDIKYIINTHPHGDHAGGNDICGKDAIIIGYKNLDLLVTKGVLSKGAEKVEGKSNKKYGSYFSMKFNGEEIKIIPYPGVHSDSDLMIHFTGSGVVHMGDLLLSESFPAIGPKVKEYLKVLEAAIDIFPDDTKFISGHGRDLSMDGVKDYYKMLLTTADIVKKGMGAGKSIADMRKERVLKDYESYNVLLDWLTTDYWIEAVYTSYK